MVGGTRGFSLWSDVRDQPSAETFVQGKPAVRRGRKARDLPPKPRFEADRPVAGGHGPSTQTHKESFVKANLARFTWAVAMLAAMALSVGAWMRW